MSTFYLSLNRGLVNYYVKFQAPDEETVRHHAAEYFGRLWCSVYTLDYFNTRIRSRYPNTRVINEDSPIVLDTWEWE